MMHAPVGNEPCILLLCTRGMLCTYLCRYAYAHIGDEDDVGESIVIPRRGRVEYCLLLSSVT